MDILFEEGGARLVWQRRLTRAQREAVRDAYKPFAHSLTDIGRIEMGRMFRWMDVRGYDADTRIMLPLTVYGPHDCDNCYRH